MRKTIHIIANLISAVFYPLWIPTYGIILFCCAVQTMMPLPFHYWLVMIGATLLLTGLLPVSLILYQVRRGYIEDIYIKKREERTLAYFETVMGFFFWWYLMANVLQAPTWLSGIALGATIAIALVAIINRWWKISAHLTGMGGLIGGVLTYNLSTGNFAYSMFISLCIITLFVMYARLYLNAHTPWQVIAGLALGLSCTLLTPLCYV